jgi:hypothetical protein
LFIQKQRSVLRITNTKSLSATHKVPASKVDIETNNPHDMEPSTRAGSIWDTGAHADAVPRRGTAVFAVDPSTPAGLSLFVRALHTQTEWHHLQPLFEEFDRGVEVRVLYNRVGTQSRGNGFINFKTVEAATAALAALNGVAGPYGVPLQLAFAWPDERYVHEATAKLFVRHVSPTATVASLTAIFAAHGAVAKCDIQADTSSAGARERTGDLMAYVTFTDAAGAASARKKIHRSIAMAGASEPLDVRCAESLAARDRRSKLPLEPAARGASCTPPNTTSPALGLLPPPPPLLGTAHNQPPPLPPRPLSLAVNIYHAAAHALAAAHNLQLAEVQQRHHTEQHILYQQQYAHWTAYPSAAPPPPPGTLVSPIVSGPTMLPYPLM